MTYTRSLSTSLAALLLSSAAFAAGEAAAQEGDEAFTLSANTALVTDYRFRGISFSDKDIAIQGGFDISHKSGLYVGTWASSIETFAGSETELDLYGGYAGTAGSLEYDVGVLAYTYPGSSGTAYLEAYASLGGALGEGSWTVGTAYAFDQSNIGSQDNIYLYLEGAYPIGESGFEAAAHFGYEDGAFGDGKLDWSLGLSYPIGQFGLGLSYVDTDLGPGLGGSAGVVGTLSAEF